MPTVGALLLLAARPSPSTSPSRTPGRGRHTPLPSPSPADAPLTLPGGFEVPHPTTTQVLLVALPVVAVLLWFAALRVVLAVTRPRAGAALPATQDLGGAEPPAVVSMLVNRWKVTEDAVESTLIDLAARGHLELRQLSDDPVATTVHVVRRAPSEDLTDYEASVLGRVRAVAVEGVVPLTALTFRDESRAATWWEEFRSAVVADARARGLSRRRVPARAAALLSAAAAVPALAVAWSVHALFGASWTGIVGAVATFTALSGVAGRPRGERDTPRGREVAGRWLGLRRYLEVDEAFQALPPSAVAVWDRYLAYGDAVGMTRVCAAVIDLGLGDRRNVWSSFGGSWHRVRVRYPAATGTYGATAPRVVLGAVVTGVLGWLLLRGAGYVDAAGTSDLPPSAARAVGIAVPVAVVAGVLLLARAAYRFVRALVDRFTPVRLRGEVLWIAPARTESREDADDVVVLYHLALDDGALRRGRPRTVAWALPAVLATACSPGDLVDVTVRRWTRRVDAVDVVEHRSVDAVAAAPAATTAPAAPAPGRRTPVRLPDLLAGAVSAATGGAGGLALAAALPASVLGEVAAALGADPGHVQARPAFEGATTGVTFDVVRDGETVPALTMVTATGPEADLLAMAHRRRGAPMDGVGDEAWSGPDWSLARRGGVVVRVGAMPGAPAGAAAAVPAVLRAALAAAAGATGVRTAAPPAVPSPGPSAPRSSGAG